MGACAGKHSYIKSELRDVYLPEPIKNNNNNNDLIVKFRESQNPGNKNLPKIYRMSYLSSDFDPKAFDFSDDLCQHILSYLCWEDRLRLECVCTQWRRLMYNSVNTIDYPIPRQAFPNSEIIRQDRYWLFVSRQVLRKCHFLRHVKLWPVCDSEVLMILAKNCQNLETIEWRFHNMKPVRRELLNNITDNCGHCLTSVKLRELANDEFHSESGLSVLIVYSEFLVNVNSVTVSIDSDKCLKYFILLADIYRDRITSLTLRLKFSTFYTQLDETFETIAQFQGLKSLHLIIESDNALDLDLTLGANILHENCPQLIHLSLEIRDSIRCPSAPVLISIQSLVKLESLYLTLRCTDIELGSLKSLQSLTHLTQLSILYTNLSDEHMNEIHDNCPYLQKLKLITRQNLSNESLYSISHLKFLVDLRIYCTPYCVLNITDTGVCQVLNNCQHIRNILFECGVQISQLTLLTLNALANSIPKTAFKFSFCWQRSVDIGDRYDQWSRLPAHELWPELLCLPENLTIVCREYFVGKCGTSMANAVQNYEK
ncbi:uncharacterized protein LOC128953636 [Oppia nitens]|uniref:uncharacterized protein LOC128953636 n=1 Tax=Oppia nitens TaxID=1686743 RepID=UPI0023DC5B99|nr:uncharacterized protein LOC128953636 [Oppia nitens]